MDTLILNVTNLFFVKTWPVFVQVQAKMYCRKIEPFFENSNHSEISEK